MNHVDCSGTEHKLVDCEYHNGTFYRHGSDWSVTCKNGKDNVIHVSPMCNTTVYKLH